MSQARVVEVRVESATSALVLQLMREVRDHGLIARFEDKERQALPLLIEATADGLPQ